MNIKSISCPDPACRGAGEPIMEPLEHFRCSTCGKVFNLASWAEDVKSTIPPNRPTTPSKEAFDQREEDGPKVHKIMDFFKWRW